jgi:hypothetical protein
MKNKTKIISIFTLIAVISHLFFMTETLGANVMFNFRMDWYYWPYIIILITASSIIILTKANKMRSWFRGLLVGSVTGGGIISSLIVISLLAMGPSQLFDIIADGTARWGYVYLPTFYLGYPAIILGAVIGVIVGKIKTK